MSSSVFLYDYLYGQQIQSKLGRTMYKSKPDSLGFYYEVKIVNATRLAFNVYRARKFWLKDCVAGQGYWEHDREKEESPTAFVARVKGLATTSIEHYAKGRRERQEMKAALKQEWTGMVDKMNKI